MKTVRENTQRSARKRPLAADAAVRAEAPRDPPSEPRLATPDAEAQPAAAQPVAEDAWSYEIASSEASSDLTPVVGHNLRRLRVKRGLSLEKLSRASNVSR